MEDVPQAGHIRFLFDPRAALTTFAGQRLRLASTVETLSTDELASPSRCAEWTVADVLRHLVWVDLTMRRLWSGDRAISSGFDPRVTPNEAVRDGRSVSDGETRDRYLSSTDTMVKDLESADPRRFGQPSISPAGKVPWWLSAVHMGWDSSIHERDVLLPLGRSVEPPDDETDLCLAYSLLLASLFADRDPMAVRIGGVALWREDGPVVARPATGADDGNGPVSGSPAVLTTDDPVKAIDALCGRGPIESALAGNAAVIGRLGALARFFTSPPG